MAVDKLFMMIVVAMLPMFNFVDGHSCIFTPSQCKDHDFQIKHCGKNELTCKVTIKDACGCCDVCPKVLKEECGGPWNVLGICDASQGLTCQRANEFSPGVCVCKNVPVPADCILESFANGCLTGNCKCKKVQYPRDCPYGLERSSDGCLTGKCKKPPICQERRRSHTSKRRYHCKEKDTIFCDEYCGNCCKHYSTCPPNSIQHIEDRQCNRFNFIGK